MAVVGGVGLSGGVAGHAAAFSQHLIDPEICIRCNTCEATCPVGAITHDSRNYVVDATICNHCMACVPPCPTGSIDNWRTMLRAAPYTVAEQLGWDDLPVQLDLPADAPLGSAEASGALGSGGATSPASSAAACAATTDSLSHAVTSTTPAALPASVGATRPPWSAAHPYTLLYGPRAAQPHVVGKVVGNVRVTDAGADYDTHHLVLDFGHAPFPLLEGQSVGVIPPGVDANGRAHHPRQYSVASPRNGERPGYNNASLTVKRVLQDHTGVAVRGVASNYLCDLKVGDLVQITGPFGASFLMPNHAGSHIVMICTGTGSAPMRAMTEWRRRQAASVGAGALSGEGGRLMLFFGARTQQELPYFGPLQSLPTSFIDINLAFSRTPGAPKRYVQDALRERAADLAPLLADDQTHFYVCGLKAMETGVLAALETVASGAGLAWPALLERLSAQGRLHLETY